MVVQRRVGSDPSEDPSRAGETSFIHPDLRDSSIEGPYGVTERSWKTKDLVNKESKLGGIFEDILASLPPSGEDWPPSKPSKRRSGGVMTDVRVGTAQMADEDVIRGFFPTNAPEGSKPHVIIILSAFLVRSVLVCVLLVCRALSDGW